MYCPRCSEKTKVIDSRRVEENVARKRECNKCGYIFYTEEMEVEEPDALRYFYATYKAEKRRKAGG